MVAEHFFGLFQITWLQNLSTLIATGGTMMVIDERISIDHKPNGHEYLTITNASIHDMSQFSCMLDSFPPTMKNFDLIVKGMFTQNITMNFYCHHNY